MLPNLKTSLLSSAAALLLALNAGALHAQAPAKGKLLVATDEVRDPNYRQTVVLLLHHDENGTLGVAINRPTWVSPEDVQPEAEGAPELDEGVFRGGPVAPTQMIFLVRDPPLGVFDGQPILEQIYASGNFSQLSALGRAVDDSSVRLFAGHSEWAAGQLEAEVESGRWSVIDGTEERVFETEPEDMWGRFTAIDSGLLVRAVD